MKEMRILTVSNQSPCNKTTSHFYACYEVDNRIFSQVLLHICCTSTLKHKPNYWLLNRYGRFKFHRLRKSIDLTPHKHTFKNPNGIPSIGVFAFWGIKPNNAILGFFLQKVLHICCTQQNCNYLKSNFIYVQQREIIYKYLGYFMLISGKIAKFGI